MLPKPQAVDVVAARVREVWWLDPLAALVRAASGDPEAAVTPSSDLDRDG
jgi:hypothetical protein